MRQSIFQIFPRVEAGRVVHKTWSVDLDTALQCLRSPSFTRDRLFREMEEMKEHFPRWILTIGVGRDLACCKQCNSMLVFDHGLRCVACERERALRKVPENASLAWFGLMPPVGVDALNHIRSGLIANPPRQHVVGHRDDMGSYLLVPLVASYVFEFPERAPSVFYLPGFFAVPGMPRDAPSHVFHMFDQGQMCLFAPGQWQKEMTVREVLQQRAYAHVIKLLNFANGKKNAFAIVS